MLIPLEKYRNPENADKVCEAINEFYSLDNFTSEDYKEAVEKVKEALKDEPEIFDEYIEVMHEEIE